MQCEAILPSVAARATGAAHTLWTVPDAAALSTVVATCCVCSWADCVMLVWLCQQGMSMCSLGTGSFSLAVPASQCSPCMSPWLVAYVCLAVACYHTSCSHADMQACTATRGLVGCVAMLSSACCISRLGQFAVSAQEVSVGQLAALLHCIWAGDYCRSLWCAQRQRIWLSLAHHLVSCSIDGIAGIAGEVAGCTTRPPTVSFWKAASS